jgi:hypothetical protein
MARRSSIEQKLQTLTEMVALGLEETDVLAEERPTIGSRRSDRPSVTSALRRGGCQNQDRWRRKAKKWQREDS